MRECHASIEQWQLQTSRWQNSRAKEGAIDKHAVAIVKYGIVVDHIPYNIVLLSVIIVDSMANVSSLEIVRISEVNFFHT